MAEANSSSKHKSRLNLPPGTTPMELIDISGTESVNELNKFFVRGVATTPVDLSKLVGKPLSVQIALPADKLRYINLVCISGRYAGEDNKGLIYELELQPWFWLASKRVNSRIFHKKTVRQILAEVMGEYAAPGTRLEDKLGGNYPELEYTVQFMETDLDFMRRMMEEFGINFHVSMAKDSHTMVLTDNNQSFPMGQTEAFDYNPNESVQILGDEYLSTMYASQQITTGAVRMMDYNFKTSTASMEVRESISRNYEGSGKENYEYPGRYLSASDGKELARRRIHGNRMPDLLAHAAGQAISMSAGTRIKVQKHADKSLDGTYVVISASHHYSANSYRTGAKKGVDTYRGDYVLVKDANPVAPQRVTPSPRMSGPQTAVVVEGAEGSIDKFGRIWVSFHWDRAGKSLPCRVAQTWAGPAWGTVFIPRVGMEVVVEFLNGDPDQPLITGCVYNDKNMPPWSLPDKKAVSGMKSTTMGGSGYNEFSIDDTAGAEKIVIHGQFNMDTTIENDVTTLIKNNSTKTIKVDEVHNVDGTQKITVKGTSKKHADQDLTITSTTKIELAVGTTKITLTPTGIKISAAQIELAATALLKTAGLKAEHGATADLSITSAMVRINS